MTIKELRKKRIISLICSMALIGILSGIPWLFLGEKVMIVRYDMEWMTGKTADEIRERYGEFDSTTTRTEFDGIYLRKARYKLSPGACGHIGQECWVEIYFDDNGIATTVKEKTNGESG